MTATNQTASSSALPRFTIQRIFNAPREKVFQAWSDQQQLEQWWGPKGMPIKVFCFEFTPGGKFHYCMQGPNHSMWGVFRYVEIQAPDRIVFINSFSNEQGEIAKAPFPFDWPLEVHNTMTLAVQDGKTVMNLEACPVNPTPQQIASFIKLHDSMQQGFGGTFDQLDALLAKAR
jgi:uncharacterized protein YndB with AHSA1/START domain